VSTVKVGKIKLQLVWRAYLVAATTQSLKAEQIQAFEALGFSLAELPQTPESSPPESLLSMLGVKV